MLDYDEKAIIGGIQSVTSQMKTISLKTHLIRLG